MKNLLLTLFLGTAALLTALPARAMDMDGGMYKEYSQAAFAQAADQNRVLFFHAGWCPACRQNDMTLQKDGIPEGTVVFKVDYDTATDLRNTYGVTSQDTFVQVDAQDNKTAEWKGLRRAKTDHFGMMMDHGMMEK